MALIRIDSNRITLPQEVFNRLKGKEIRFVEFHDGFVMEPVSIPKRKTGMLSKLGNLKSRRIIHGDPDELIHIKVGEWNEIKNL